MIKSDYIIKTKTKRPTSWILERCTTKKQAFNRFKVLSGYYKLTFKEFLKDFLIIRY